MKAVLLLVKKGRKKSKPLYLHARTESQARKKANDTIWRTLRCAEKEYAAGDKTRMKALKGSTFCVIIATERNVVRDMWKYSPTVRY